MVHPRRRGRQARDRSRLLAPLGVLALWLALAGSSTGAASAGPPADSRLQDLIDATPAGGTLQVPPGLYRESVVITRPITIDGTDAEIRGSDLWSEWEPDGSRWRSTETVPAFESNGECVDPRCAWPAQVEVDDHPLREVASAPATGQFALDAQRRVILGDDPSGQTVEVTTRTTWITVKAADTTITGLTMRDVASPAQSGGIEATAGADRLTVRDVHLSDSHGALVNFEDVTGGRLTGSVLTRGGQLAVHASGDTDLLIDDNQITHGNTEGFDPIWEAGGLKVTHSSGVSIRDNTVQGNDGPGIWCDLDCADVTISGNHVGENTRAGIMFEVSDGAVIVDNVVWENGWGFATWGWGAGILISSSANVMVRGNTVAWNADGITVVSQDRTRKTGDQITHVSVMDDTVIGDPGSHGYLLAWLEDWDSGLYDSSAGNEGSGNRFWQNVPEPAECRFEWDGCRDRIADFISTRGGRGSVYIDDAQRDVALIAAGLADAPPPVHPPVYDPPRKVTIIRWAAVAGTGVGLLILAIVLAWLIRRRRARARSV